LHAREPLPKEQGRDHPASGTQASGSYASPPSAPR
jgi:hypothetical protein